MLGDSYEYLNLIWKKLPHYPMQKLLLLKQENSSHWKILLWVCFSKDKIWKYERQKLFHIFNLHDMPSEKVKYVLCTCMIGDWPSSDQKEAGLM